MPERRPTPSPSPGRNDPAVPVRVADVAKYLLRTADLHKDAKSGNPAFGDELRRFAKSLGPCAKLSLDEFADTVKTRSTGKHRAAPSKAQPVVELPANLESLSLNEVEKILNNRDYIKAQLAELGEKRFGISRSELLRRGRGGVLGSIRIALENERTLNIIAQEARRVGALRSA